jgi:hypothetical protein
MEAPIQRPDAPPCTACRVTGTLTFAGIAGWLVVERARLPRTGGHPGHRALLAGLSAAFAAAAVWRATSDA